MNEWESKVMHMLEARVQELEARLALERELVEAAVEKRYAAETRVKELEARNEQLRSARDKWRNRALAIKEKGPPDQ